MTDSLKIALANARIDSLQNVIIKNQIEITEKAKILEVLIDKNALSKGYFIYTLNGQLALFLFLVGLFGFISWKGINKSFKKEIKESKDDLEKILATYHSELDMHTSKTETTLQEFKEDYEGISYKLSATLIITLAQSVEITAERNHFQHVRLIALALNENLELNGNIKKDEPNAIKYLKHIQHYLNKKELIRTGLEFKEIMETKNNLLALKAYDHPSILMLIGTNIEKIEDLQKEWFPKS